MDSERFSGAEDEVGAGLPAEKDKAPSGGGAGATAVFGGLPSEPVRAELGEGSERALPVVHSVVFKADSSRAEGTDQLMNILRSPALKAEGPPLVPSPSAPPPTASSGGFTQLLRALNYEQVKEPNPAQPKKQIEAAPAPASLSLAMPQVTSFQTQPVASAPAGSFTQLFQSGAQVVEPTKVEAAPAAAMPGSFTQMFQALDAASPEPAKLKDADGSTTPDGRALVVDPAATSGSFTQMFRTLDAAPLQSTLEEPLPMAEAARPGSFTEMFAAVSSPTVEPVNVESVPVAGPEPGLRPAATNQSSPGSFTRMFRTLDAAPVEMKESEAPIAAEPGTFTQMFSTPAAPAVEVAQPELGRAVPADSPSSFTQMFRALDAAPADTAHLAQAPAAAAGPGSFTQMFQAGSSPALEPTKREAAPVAAPPGSFTQMFRAPASSTEPARGEPQAGAASSPGSFTQMFRALDGTQAPEPHREPLRAAPSFTPFESAPPAPARLDPTPSSTAAAGGLTQLLRTLDQPSQTPSLPYQPPAGLAPSLGGQPSASFTSVYGTLAGEAPLPAAAPATAAPAPQQVSPSLAGRDATQAFRMPETNTLPASAAPAEAGPSEFTRILNASTLRESALRGGGQANEAAAQPAPSAAGSPSAPSWAMPAAPKLLQAPHLPQVPKVPELKLPEAPKVQAVGGMQQYLPLLLILVIFLLLAILVAVVFLMKR